VLSSLAVKGELEPREKIVNLITDEWFPSRLSFGKEGFLVKAEMLKC